MILLVLFVYFLSILTPLRIVETINLQHHSYFAVLSDSESIYNLWHYFKTSCWQTLCSGPSYVPNQVCGLEQPKLPVLHLYRKQILQATNELGFQPYNSVRAHVLSRWWWAGWWWESQWSFHFPCLSNGGNTHLLELLLGVNYIPFTPYWTSVTFNNY